MVTEVFDNLKALQEILVEKYDLEAKVNEAPKQLSSQDELLARLKKEYIAKNAEYDELKQKVGSLKLELDEAVKSREIGEKGMDAITTHREYEALEKQISEAQERENNVRKDLQREEKKLSELNESLKNYEDMISSQEKDLETSKQNQQNTIDGYKTRIAELEAEENKYNNLDKEILFKFQRIIQRNTDGIVAVRNGVCTGCHMILPAQFANIVHSGENINFCPYCSRILYYEEVSEEEAANYFDINSSGSLADLDDDYAEDEYEDSENEDSESSDIYDEDDDLIEDEDLSDEDEENEDDEDSEEESE